MKRLLLGLWCALILLGASLAEAQPSFDSTEYRQATYGAPDHYCDFTKSATGTGTSGDPWNPAQCKSQPVCGNVIGVLDVGSGATGTIQRFAVAGLDTQEAAFRPTNAAVQGTACVGNPVVYVARYAAITMVNLDDPTSSTIATNANRTEVRHDGVADAADVVTSGHSAMGCYNQSYVTFDGFYIKIAENGQSGDQGTLAARSDGAEIVTECKFRNFALQGAITDMDSNAVLWRPGPSLRSELHNFAAWDFDNQPTGGGLNQDGMFSDNYGDQDFLVEYFLMDGVERGFYPKGATGCPGSCRYNYGTLRYGIIRDTGGADASPGECSRWSALHESSLTEVHHVLMVNCVQSGASFGAEASVEQRNLLFRHVTIANLSAGASCAGPLYWVNTTLTETNVEFRDNIFDIASGCNGHMVDAGGSSAIATSMHHNAYFDADTVYSWSFNGAEQTSLADWRTATGLTETGSNTISDPFISRTVGNANYYRISGGHAALTMSSTGGEVGAFEGSVDPGPYVSAGGSGGTRLRLRIRSADAALLFVPFAVMVWRARTRRGGVR